METEIENTVEKTAQEPDTETLRKEIESGRAALAEIKNALSVKETEVAALNNSLEEAQKTAETAGTSLTAAVGAYRKLVVQGNPGVPAEMIGGDSIETINDSLQKARAIMARARQELEAEAARVRVPAGAPQRTPQDLSALTAREKIQLGIRG
jgi:hypothetical protein